MKAQHYMEKLAEEMGLQVIYDPRKDRHNIMKGDREVLVFTHRYLATVERTGHHRNLIDPHFRHLAHKLAEENKNKNHSS